MTPHSFATAIGLPRSQVIYDIKSEKIKSISLQLATQIKAKFPTLSIDWLTKGEGDMYIIIDPFKYISEPYPMQRGRERQYEETESKKLDIKGKSEAIQNDKEVDLLNEIIADLRERVEELKQDKARLQERLDHLENKSKSHSA